MNLFKLPSLLPIAALFAAQLAAQNVVDFSAVRTQNYGVPLAGGSTTLRASARVTTPTSLLGTTSLNAALSNVASVRLFGNTREAAAMVASLTANRTFSGLTTNGPIYSNATAGSFAVRLGGYTVYSSSSFNGAQTGSPVANVFQGSGVGYSVSLLGLEVGLNANASARATYSLVPAVSFANMTIDVDGSVRSNATGFASASVSFLGASAGVSSTLNFANTNGTADLHVSPSSTSGTVAYSVQPIRLLMQAFASVFGATAAQVVFDYALGGSSGNLVLNRV